MDPLITIAMPVYNCEATIAQAIRSILHQTICSWELIIIDDGSTDRTVEQARAIPDPRIRVFSDGRNLQLPMRLNEAVTLARGRYLARMDGDDVSYPKRLEKQLQVLQANPGVDLLGAPMLVFRSDGSIKSVTEILEDHEAICGSLWSGFHLAHPTWIAETAWFRSHPYDPEATLTQDRELLMRSHRDSRFAAVPEILYAWRQDAVLLTKVVPMRRQLRSSMWRYYNSHGESIRAVLCAAIETGKLAADLFAEASGVNYRQWRADRVPIDDCTRLQWEQLWAKVNSA